MPLLAHGPYQKRKTPKMNTNRISTWFQLFLLALPFVVIAAVWNNLPERIPIHWNARGQVDGYGDKTFSTLIVPCTNIFLALLLSLLPRIDPKLGKLEPETRASLWHTV